LNCKERDSQGARLLLCDSLGLPLDSPLGLGLELELELEEALIPFQHLMHQFGLKKGRILTMASLVNMEISMSWFHFEYAHLHARYSIFYVKKKYADNIYTYNRPFALR
jgi:hypothetical protein